MIVLDLAVRSLRHRSCALVACFLAVFLGATILMAFGSLLETGVREGVDGTSRATLVTMTAVAGGWALIMVIFAVVSTLTLAVRQRASEMALLKSIGATPAQVTRMVVGEAAIVSLGAAFIAVPTGFVLGRIVLDLLKDTDQVRPGVRISSAC